MDNNTHNYIDPTSQKADNLFFNHRPFRLRLLEKMTVIFFFALVGAATGRAILAILWVLLNISDSSYIDSSGVAEVFFTVLALSIGAIIGAIIGAFAAKLGRFNLFNSQGNVLVFGLQWGIVSAMVSVGRPIFFWFGYAELWWIIPGLVIGVAQWMMLPLWSSRTRFWILASLLIWLLFMWVETFLSFRLNVLGFAAAVAFVGLLAGSLQWYILRRVPRAEWLIPISVMSVLISDLMLPLLRSIYFLGYINLSGIYFPTRIHFIYWVVMGTAIGWVLKNAYQTQLEHTD
ncbi:MAG: hypothetical protein CL608_29430 [Anaerolineaceae bacterium]|nr:hypothetical protein [Anaerolineaceae bacterium]